MPVGLLLTQHVCAGVAAADSGLDPAFSSTNADAFSLAIVGDLHLEQKGMRTFNAARQQLKEVLQDGDAGEARVVQLGDLGGYNEKPGALCSSCVAISTRKGSETYHLQRCCTSCSLKDFLQCLLCTCAQSVHHTALEHPSWSCILGSLDYADGGTRICSTCGAGSMQCFKVADKYLRGFLPVRSAVVIGNHDLEGEDFETDEANLAAWTQVRAQDELNGQTYTCRAALDMQPESAHIW